MGCSTFCPKYETPKRIVEIRVLDNTCERRIALDMLDLFGCGKNFSYVVVFGQIVVSVSLLTLTDIFDPALVKSFITYNIVLYKFKYNEHDIMYDIFFGYYTLKILDFYSCNMYMSFLNNILNGDLLDFVKFMLDADTNNDLEHIKRKKHHKKHKRRHNHHDHHDHHNHHESPPVYEVVSKKQNKEIMKKLHEVTRQIQHKVSTDVQVNLEDYFIHTPKVGDTDEYFTPKMIQIKLDNNRYIEVPKFTLVNHSNVDLKQLNCVFRTDAKSLGITCKENFDIETNAVFEQNSSTDGFTKLNEMLISEYMHPITLDTITLTPPTTT
jgi:hypothetical protein